MIGHVPDHKKTSKNVKEWIHIVSDHSGIGLKVNNERQEENLKKWKLITHFKWSMNKAGSLKGKALENTQNGIKMICNLSKYVQCS